ncbi:hypothetical protein [Rhodococcus sp. ACS1]|uniref:hypothetical protein n=1 Tax=Rhodococcus sp. ACS1 TaxID=2028570 RepID=UPI001C53368B|nr:hypothetical protein [Rhodococcus sp. ACS1]
MTLTRELFDTMTAKSGLSSEVLAGAVDALQECEEIVAACSMGMLRRAGRPGTGPRDQPGPGLRRHPRRHPPRPDPRQRTRPHPDRRPGRSLPARV